MSLVRKAIVVAIVILLVVGILIFSAYSIGVTSDWNGSDPTGQDREPIAYATIYYKVGVKNEYDRFKSKVYELDVTVQDWTGSDASTDWNALGFWDWNLEDDVKLRAKFDFSGPGNVRFTGYTEWQEMTIPELSFDYTHVVFETPRILFYDSGTYRVTAELYIECDEFTGLLDGAVKTISFEV